MMNRFSYENQEVAELGLSKYVEMLLRGSNINTVEQLLALTPEELKNLRRIGKKSLLEIETMIFSLK